MKLSNAQLTDEYFAIVNGLAGDVDGRRAAYEHMKNSTAIVHGEVIASTFIPRLFDHATYTLLQQVSSMMYGILCKVIERYVDDPEYRTCFSFDSRLEELILLPRGYDAFLPFARIDVFLDEDMSTIKFCEFNADGSSGMNEDREVFAAIATSQSYKTFTEKHAVAPNELVMSWVEEFMRMYSTYEHRVDDPHVALCDFLEHATLFEFEIYAEAFRSFGIECSIVDVRDLYLESDGLYSPDGKRVDAIWRRCVTNDIIAHWEEAQTLIEAVRQEKVALIGSFAGHLVHDKQIFKVLRQAETAAFLTEEENAFIKHSIPHTAFLDVHHIDLRQVVANKDAWVIKPIDHYGADLVYLGCNQTEKEWAGLVECFANNAHATPFLAQEFCTPFKTMTLSPDTALDVAVDEGLSCESVPYNNLTGLYLYNGRFAGAYSRLGPLSIVSGDYGGVTAATLWVDCP